MPSPAIGSQSVLGVSPMEATFGAATTVDRFYPFVSEGIKRKNRVMQSQGLRGGYLPRGGGRRVFTGHDAAGDVMLEVSSKGFSRILQWILGGTPTIAQQAATAAYLHTHTMGSLVGRSANVQKQLKDPSGVAVGTFTNRGTKVNTAEFKIDVDGILGLSLGLDIREERTDVAAAAASYVTDNLFHFQQAVLTIAGVSQAQVYNAAITVNNNLNVDRRHLGNSGLKSEQVDDGFRMVSGTFSADFDTTTLYALYAADTAATLDLTFTGPLIASTFFEKLQITVPEIHLTGDTPTVGGPGLVRYDLPFEAAFDGTLSPITAALTTTDIAV